jgi:hypothetical protein
MLKSLVSIFDRRSEAHKSIDGIKGILNKVKEAKTVVELPHDYQKVFSFVHRHFGPRIQEELGSSAKRVSKLKTMYILAPKTYNKKIFLFFSNKKRAIKTIFKITNPISVVSGMLNLFLARPLGARNLLQRMLAVATDIERTERDIKDYKKIIANQKISNKIHAWVAKYYDPLPFEDIQDISSNLQEDHPHLASQVADLSDSQEFVLRMFKYTFCV